MDAGELNLALTVAMLIATFLLRKRILAALGRLLFDGAVKFARAEFLVEDVSEGEDGAKRVRIGLSAPAKAIVAALTPVLIAEALKTVKLKPGGLPGSIPPGLDLSNLSSALPAILPMLPKKYQGYAALLAPFLGKFLGGGKEQAAAATKENPFLKELEQ